MIKWKKLGRIFLPSGDSSWMKSHAAVPFVEKLQGNIIRIYFSSRNEINQSLIGWIKIDLNNPSAPIEVSKEPLLELGTTGLFDEDGVMGCDLVTINGKKHLFYIGWNLGLKVPFRNALGLAKYDSTLRKFNKFSKGPILDRSVHDPCFVASCCVIRTPSSYLMYYLSCTAWEKNEDTFRHKYHIKIAVSEDGVIWNRTGKVAVDFKNDKEYAISVPRVHFINGQYRMWYSFRGGENETYRIGYAESGDAENWIRKDHLAGIDVSKEGWDSEMICYPYIFEYNEKLYMLYNGNGYGKTGFGIAISDGEL